MPIYPEMLRNRGTPSGIALAHGRDEMPHCPATARKQLAAALVATVCASPAVAALDATYAWSLASPTGPLRSSGVSLSYDAKGKELFVVDGGKVRVFGESGMETFAFGGDAALGAVRDVAALDGGDLLVLSASAELSIVRCNFRGEVLGRFEPRGIPAALAGFSPAFIRQRAGRVYLADPRAMVVAVLDADGAFLASHDLAALAGVAEKRADTGFRGFGVDAAGNLLFTVQPLFAAFVVAPDGTVRSFGVRGSAPGKFNVVGPIGADDRGNLYVADMLRSVVIVFDRELRFVREFGYRGKAPGNLAVPVDLAVGNGKVFVSQYAQRGVSVFDVADD